jgi:hypothetical protein
MSTARELIRARTAALAARRRTLATARALAANPSPNASSSSPTQQIEHATRQLAALHDALARARAGLVQELVEVFHVVEVGGRPAVSGKAGTRGEWTIGGLVLPVPGDMRRAFHLPSANGFEY